MDFIETEIEVTRNANNEEYLKMIEDMEQEMIGLEKDKIAIGEELVITKKELERIQGKFKESISDKNKLNDQVV